MKIRECLQLMPDEILTGLEVLRDSEGVDVVVCSQNIRRCPFSVCVFAFFGDFEPYSTEGNIQR